MAQRYVRIRAQDGQVYYGCLLIDGSVQVLSAAPWNGGQPTDQAVAWGQYTLLPPCTPSKIVAVGRNYSAHAAEMGAEVPPEPLLFLKPPSTLIANGESIICPSQSQRVDYEGELALVIGAVGRNCTAQDARSLIWGYTIANDVTARDLQHKDAQWTRAKGFDTFCPLGPWVVREISPAARLQTFLADCLVQSATLEQMVFTPEQIVTYITQVMTLLPGDVVLTGTPEGIGPLVPGQQVRVEIEGIGSLENSVITPGGADAA